MADELIKFEIVVDAASGQATLKQFGQVVQSTAGQVVGSANQMGSAFRAVAAELLPVIAVWQAFKKSFDFIKDGIKEQMEFNRATIAVSAQLVSMGINAQQALVGFEDLTQSVSRLAGITQGEAARSFQMFIGLTKNAQAAAAALAVTMEIARQRGLEFNVVQNIMASLLEGKVTKQMKDLGIVTTDASGKVKSTVDIFDELIKTTGELNITPIDEMNIAMDELQDSFKAAAPVVNIVLQIVSRTIVSIGAMLQTIGNVVAGAILGIKTLITLATAIPKLLSGDFAGAATIARGAIQDFQDGGSALIEMTEESWQKAADAWAQGFDHVGDAARKAKAEGLDKLRDALKARDLANAAADAKKLADEFDRMTGSTKALTEEDAKLEKAYELVVKQFNEGLITLQKTEYMLGKIVDRRFEISKQTNGVVGIYGAAPPEQSFIQKFTTDTIKTIDEAFAKIADLKDALGKTSKDQSFLSTAIGNEALNQFDTLRTLLGNMNTKQLQDLMMSFQDDKNKQGMREFYDMLVKLNETGNTSLSAPQDLFDHLKLLYFDPANAEAFSDALKDAAKNAANLKAQLEGFEALDSLFQSLGFDVKDVIASAIPGADEIFYVDSLAEAFRSVAEAIADATGEAQKATPSFLKLYSIIEGIQLVAKVMAGSANIIAKSFVQMALTGKGSIRDMRIAIGDMLASMAIEQFARALTAAAMGAIASTPWGAAFLGPPASYFAAAKFHAVAGAALVAGAKTLGAGASGSSFAPANETGNNNNTASSPEAPPANPTQGLRPLEVTIMLEGAGFIQDIDGFARDLTKAINRAGLQGSNAPLIG